MNFFLDGTGYGSVYSYSRIMNTRESADPVRTPEFAMMRLHPVRLGPHGISDLFWGTSLA